MIGRTENQRCEICFLFARSPDHRITRFFIHLTLGKNRAMMESGPSEHEHLSEQKNPDR